MGKQSGPLIRIAESLHCHIPGVRASAQRWLAGDTLDRQAGDLHLRQLVIDQVGAGADFLDVNVDDFFTVEGIGHDGARRVLAHILDLIADHGGGVPPCIDSSDPSMLEFGLRHYHESSGGTRVPLVNSVTVNRLEALQLRAQFPFAVVGMLLERAGDDAASGFTDIADAGVYHETAKQIFAAARQAGLAPGDIYFDPTVGPLGADMVGYTKRTFEGIRLIREDADMAGVHVVLGLSNCSDGLPRRLSINRAYLRVAMEYGVDAAICDVGKISGKDLVDGRILKLIRRIATGVSGGGDASTDALMLLVDYAQSQRRAPAAAPRQAGFDDPFGRALVEPQGEPVFMLELAPAEGSLDQILSLAEEARDSDYIFTITDTPGGNRTPGPDTLALEVARLSGRQPIMNLSCKSDDRNALIRRCLALYHQGLRHFFAVTGDYPNGGRPVFDLDSVSLVMALDTLRRGLDFPDLLPRPGGALEGLRVGAAVSPFKYAEADTWGQYLKAWKKRRAGANYFITQLGFDVAKFQELKLWLERAGIGDTPVFPMVYFLTPQFLRVLNRVHVAGAVIPDELKRKYQGRLGPKKELKKLRALNFSELAEQQRRQAVRRSALLSHILLAGLNFRGIDLAGITQMDDARAVRDELARLGGRDWRESWEEYRDADGTRPMELAPLDDAFYLFEHGEDGLLKTDGAMLRADRSRYEPVNPKMRRLHERYFEEGKGLNGLLQWMVGGPEEGARLRWATLLEQAAKTSKLGCEMCGDCRIAALAYLCPEPTAGCAKRLLNGPCAGADLDGGCEVIPERRCYWGRVIEAMLAEGDVEPLYALQPPKDPALAHTSSWRNEVQGRCPQPVDLGAPPVAARPQG